MQRNKIASGIVAALVLATGIALTLSNASAKRQGAGGRGAAASAGKTRKSGKHAQTLEKYAGELNLTDDQKTRIRQVMASVKTERARFKNNASLTREARRAEAKTIARNASERIKAILTPAQEAKVKELRRAAREDRRATTASAKRTGTSPRGGLLKG